MPKPRIVYRAGPVVVVHYGGDRYAVICTTCNVSFVTLPHSGGVFEYQGSSWRKDAIDVRTIARKESRRCPNHHVWDPHHR